MAVIFHKAGRKETGHSRVCYLNDSRISGLWVDSSAITLASASWSQNGYHSSQHHLSKTPGHLYPFT